MRELPTGTVTLLFSDIDGSTALLSRIGDRYREVLSAERTLTRAAVRACGGWELESEGGSSFMVFGSAADAVECCVAAQRALAAHSWPEGVAVRVRMGLHSGEPARHEDGYVGMDVHRAARIAAAAHGGQVVLSEAAMLLAQSRLPTGVSVRDLGWHRLKDIDAPERIYQLIAGDLPDQFPPLKSLGAQTRLPEPLTPLVGRDLDLDQLRLAILSPGVRLVTLTGAGGVGKTRLALAAAASLDGAFEHGVYFIGLAAVRDGEGMWKTIADSMDVGGDGPGSVTDYLRGRRILLVLDNLEQLDGAAGVVADLLAVSGVVVLATSRRPLHLLGEYEQPVAPLDLPPSAEAEEVAACGSTRLFAQQAAMVRPGFTITPANAADVAAICRQLDGLPLAIELAASRVKLLPPRALLARLADSLSLVAGDGGRPSRQQTLRNTIAWSYELLGPDLAGVFRRMGVFAGGCDLDALAAVAGDADGPTAGTDPLELVAGLLDVSLITVAEGAGGEPRLGTLETVRQYAIELLEQAGDLEDARRRHAMFYALFAERAHDQLTGPAELAALDRMEAEHGNLRTALAWALDAGQSASDERAAIGLRLVQALSEFWYRHGHTAEGRRWLERAVELASDESGPPHARLAHWLGVMLQQQGELRDALRLLHRGLAICRGLGDRNQEARALNSLGITYFRLGDLDAARSMLEGCAAIAREIHSDVRLSQALGNLGQVEIEAGNLERSEQLLREALPLYQQRGELLGATNCQQALAMASLRAGRAQQAHELLSGTLRYVIDSGDTQLLANTIEVAAIVVADLGDGLRAARLAGAADAIRQQAGMPRPEPDAALLERFLGPARATFARVSWDTELAAGRALTQEAAKLLLSSFWAGDATSRQPAG